MKKSNPHDLLDSKIDKLLANQPLKPSADFTSQVLEAADRLNSERRVLANLKDKLSSLALPIAALLVIAFTLARFISVSSELRLTDIEMNEIFLLEEGLSGLVQLKDENFNETDLLSTLNSLIDS